MKSTFFIIAFFLSFLLLSKGSQAQTYWMQKAGGINNDEGYDISTDSTGNSYTTGYFLNSATFGSTTLSSSGVTDIFITKNDVLGNYVWSVKGGGTGADRGLSIKTDKAGNSFITGYYFGSATFGSSTITSVGGQDIFIAKYDNAGTLQWLKSAGGLLSDIGNSITVDNSGNVIITGEFTGTATFGSFSLTSLSGTIDVFTAKLDSSGNFLWAKKGSAEATDRGIDVGCDPAGNIYVTGQFSDTILFDVVHNNNIYNAIFLIKYDPLGQEQWFQKIGGGTMNVVSGIVVDAGSNIFITGDFTGNLTFFGPPSLTLINPYSNKVFVACYNSSGSLLWKEADGSNSSITSKNIALDNAGNPFIVGNFKCRLNEYADQYGQGIFNSVGYEDIFVTKYNNLGAWQWSRQTAGPEDDYGKGIALNPSGQPIITGSFQERIGFATSSSIGYGNYTLSGGGSYCGDANYGNVLTFLSDGNADIIIAKSIDPTNEPYDYYWRFDLSGCSKEDLGVCIYGLSISGCPDTIPYCGSNIIGGQSRTTPAGPEYSYLWSTGETDGYITISTSGHYWVEQTSVDGCFVSHDTSYVAIHPIPDIPSISDDAGININAIITDTVRVCYDSVLLTGGNYLPNNCMWIHDAGTGILDTTFASTILATVSDYYLFVSINTFGCKTTNYVIVEIDSILPPLIPEMICTEDTSSIDSINICEDEVFTMYIFDTISNPLANYTCIPDLTVIWTASPAATISYYSTTNCSEDFTNTINIFAPIASGLYTISALLIRQNTCDADTLYISRNIYVTIDPNPVISVTGNTLLCPGDSSLLIATGGVDYIWIGTSTGIYAENDSVYVDQTDYYDVFGMNEFGCYGFNSIMVNLKPQPVVSPSNSVICPNDSVPLFCTGSGNFEWYGPSGIIPSSGSSIYAITPGYYYCVNTDPDSCEVVSNTVYVNEYSTPILLTSPSEILCPGDSVIINAITNAGSLVVWQSPLSGSDSIQVITSPGIYTCTITSCGILTNVSVTIISSTIAAVITSNGSLTFCDGDSVLLSGNPGVNSYFWEPSGSSQPSIFASQSGVYTLTTSDINGCTAETSATINVT
ncbi:MAG: hypothetical protein M3R27_15550, partial [Bacteroidota bacterium]|nr:hypothetical protein [Bacteroidota bacterium]